jgi:hypothetical protein
MVCSKCNMCDQDRIRGRGGRDRMVVGFTTIYASSAYHHWCEFESRSGRGVQHYVSNLLQVGGFLRILRFSERELSISSSTCWWSTQFTSLSSYQRARYFTTFWPNLYLFGLFVWWCLAPLSIVLSHWINIPLVHMSLNLSTLSWYQDNSSLFMLFIGEFVRVNITNFTNFIKLFTLNICHCLSFCPFLQWS